MNHFVTSMPERPSLKIDEYHIVHFPARVLLRYDLQAGVEAFWNVEYGALIFVFVKKSEADVQPVHIPDNETWPLEAQGFFAAYEGEIDFGGSLPARFGFVIEDPDVSLDNYRGPGDEAVIVSLQWRQG
jgi:hypothetical protein